MAAIAPPGAAPLPAVARSAGGASGGGAPEVGITQAQMLVRRAWMGLEVDSVSAVTTRATAVAGALGGYVHSAREAENESVMMTIRVPSNMLEAAMDSIATFGKVDSRRITADDVTEQVVDLDGRATTLRATRDRLRALLQQASGVSEIITVERELHRVQTELEIVERRLLTLQSTAALADLSIDAHPPTVLGPIGLLFTGVGWMLRKAFVIQ